MMNNDVITTALLAGIVKGEAGKKAKHELAEGTRLRGEITFRVPFTLNKGMAYDVKPTVNLLSQAVIGKALAYSGVTAPAFKQALLRAAKEALDEGKKVGDVVSDEDRRVVDEIQKIQDEVIALLPRQKRSGVVTINAKPEIIESNIQVV